MARREWSQGVSAIKILHILGGHAGLVSGVETQTLTLVRKFDRQKYAFVIAYAPQGRLRGDFEAAGAKVMPFKTRSKIDLFAIHRLIKTIKVEGIRIACSHGPRVDLMTSIAAKHTGVRFVVDRQVDLSWYPYWGAVKKRLYRVADNYALTRADKVITPSEMGRQALLRDYRLPEAGVTVIRNGIDLNEFKIRDCRSDVEKQFGIPRDDPIVGIVAQLTEWKGHRYLLEGIPLVLKSVPRAKFLVVGGGDLMDQLKNLARDLGVSSSVIFTGYRSDVKELMGSFDLCVLCSIREGLPNAVIEAMAMGKAVVATDVGAARELVQDGNTGYVVPPRNPPALARAIVTLVKDKAKALSFGAGGRQFISKGFDIGSVVSQHENVFLRLACAGEDME